MKLRYYPDTDTLYIEFLEHPSTESEEISQDVIVDFDANGGVVGVTVEHASERVDLVNPEVKTLLDNLTQAA